MTRLIDADSIPWDVEGVGTIPVVTKEEIDSMKTVDAEPVVRCKDCKYYQQGRNADDWLWCMMNHHYTDEEKYCAWAERKEE